MSSLRQELKQFEAAFRKQHGRDPSPQDIRQQPDIAKKYKQYQREKSAAKAGKPSASASTQPIPDRPVASTSTAPANPFKTPTKPKPRSRTTRPAEANPDGPSSDVMMGPASPSQRLSAGSSKSKPASQTSADADSKAPASQERYVVANSPSKLRALAALHSTSGSPNKRSSATGLASTASDSSRSAAPPLIFDSLKAKSVGQASPQKKAVNPFASPQKGAFGAFEREEREKLRAKRAELKKQRRASASSSSSVLGKGATSAGAGLGTATLVPSDERTPFARTVSRSSASGMDLDEVDDFFGGSVTTQRHYSPAGGSGAALPDQDDEDESLGPSPVKPASGSSTVGCDLAPPFRPFQPLIPDRPPPSSASSSSRQPSQPPSSRPKPFLAPLPASQTSAATGSAVPKSNSTVPQKRADPGDRADAFHADQAEKPDAKRKKVAGSAKSFESANDTANGKGKSKGNAKAKTRGSATANAIGTVQHGPIGEIVVEVGGSDEDEDKDSASSASSGSDQEAGDGSRGKKKRVRKPTERIVIHNKAAMARQKALERQERYRELQGDDTEAADEDGELEAIDISTTCDEDRRAFEDDFPDPSLFGPARRVDLLAKLGARPRSCSRSRSPSTREADDQAALAASLPADLAEILSLRTSPSKAHVSTAKARQVARILGEPSGRRATGRTKPGGLLDFASDDEDGGGDVDDEGEGDDDWDEEVDGWEGAGEAMDGYYSGEEY